MPLTTSIATVSLSGLLEDKLEAIAGAGFEAVEIFEQDLVASPLSPHDVRSRCDDLGLTVALYQPFRDFEGVDPDEFRRSMARADAKFAVAAELGAPLVLFCSNVATATVDDDALVASQLHAAGDLATRWGLGIAYEALAWGRYVSDYAHAWRLAAAADHPAVGTCLDSFHILSRGSSLDAIAELPADRLFFCQLADAHRTGLDILSWSRHHRLFPGQGDWDLADFTARVLATGYDGPVSIEVFNDVFRQTDPRRTAADAARSLRALADGVARRTGATGSPDLLPEVGPALSLDFVELASADHAPLARLLTAIGLADRGTHRRKSVDLWSAGDARIIVNHATRGTPAVTAVGIGVADAVAAGRRARELRAEEIERSTLADEQLLVGVQAPDGTETYFATVPTEGEPAWAAEFPRPTAEDHGILGVDHVSISQPWAYFDEAVLYYRAVLGLETEEAVDVADPGGLVRSQVLQSRDRRVRLVLNVLPLRQEGHGHETTTHIALACRDLVRTIDRLREAGIALLEIPTNYYDDLDARFGIEHGELEVLQNRGILYDRQGDAEFLQAYLLPAGDFFVELVERRGGYDGFGAPNAPVRRAAQARAAMPRPRTAA